MSRWWVYFVCCVLTTLATTVVFVNQRIGAIVVPLFAESRVNGAELEDTCRNRSCRWEKEQESRKIQLRDACSAFRMETGTYYPPLVYQYDALNQPKTLNNLYVIPSHRLIYCSIPKVSSTSWKRLFLKMSNISDSMEAIGQAQSHAIAKQNFRTLASYPAHEARKLLAAYTTFFFVRDPFARLLSAYQDKFQNDYPASKVFRRTWSEKIIRFTAPSPAVLGKRLRTQRRNDGTLNVTFSQFARFVSLGGDDAKAQKKRGNVHWIPMYAMCQPCLIDYDYIGHYDSVRTDADFILTSAGVDRALRFPNFTTNPTGSSNPSTLFRYYSTLTKYEIEDVYKHFSLDFDLFSFEIPTVISHLFDRKNV
ncbi:carbohydrate sulfotransferase 10-like [Asterias rubens]|uniref:carbohydrate sulfotransferase 10-like n=1 Tax=Asterias rubens TaxID=7604 RepID=UPI001455895C|nr:carbohydrate sulfotransferase 10-like [Asterias rubens]